RAAGPAAAGARPRRLRRRLGRRRARPARGEGRQAARAGATAERRGRPADLPRPGHARGAAHPPDGAAQGIPGLDLQALIRTVGYVGLFAIVFAESCLLFFLPGDSLLFTAGVLSSGVVSDLKLDLTLLIVLLSIAAVTGNSLGYAIGYRVGRRLFSNPSPRPFRPEHLERPPPFLAKHAGNA